MVRNIVYSDSLSYDICMGKQMTDGGIDYIFERLPSLRQNKHVVLIEVTELITDRTSSLSSL